MFIKQFQKKKLMKLLTSKWITKPIFAASEIGLFEIISKKPKSIGEIAKATKTKPQLLYRLLRALASFGFIKETCDQKYKSNNLSKILEQQDMQAMIAMFQSEWHDNAWNCLTQALRTGANAFELGNGVADFEYFKKNPKAAHQFSRANFIKTQEITKIVNSFDFSNYETVTDIGGGYNSLILHILQSNSHLRCTIVDLDYLKKEANRSITNNNLQDRCEFIAGNFFENIPVKSDVFILCNILHDWDDNRSKQILDNCQQAMDTSSRLLIIEMVVPQGKQQSVATLMDLEVLVMGNGKERTHSEFQSLLEKTGLGICEMQKFKKYHLIECNKI